MKKTYSTPLTEVQPLLSTDIFLQSGSTEPISQDPNIYNW